MNIKFAVYMLVVFLLIATTVYSLTNELEKPMFIELIPKEKPSPYDWIKESSIHVLKDRVIIDIKDAEWAAFTDTNSMDPVIDMGANAIQIIPKSEEDIHMGDIISYESKYEDGTIIHRVVDIGEDENGRFFVAKGDNNSTSDPENIRFSQIKRVLVAVIY